MPSLIKRLYYSWVPSWKNWDKERGFVEAEIVPPRVIVDPESGATIFAAIFQGRWTTQALALARGSSDALLPKRHIWKLFGQGAATLVVYVDSDTELKTSAIVDPPLREVSPSDTERCLHSGVLLNLVRLCRRYLDERVSPIY